MVSNSKVFSSECVKGKMLSNISIKKLQDFLNGVFYLITNAFKLIYNPNIMWGDAFHPPPSVCIRRKIVQS